MPRLSHNGPRITARTWRIPGAHATFLRLLHPHHVEAVALELGLESRVPHDVEEVVRGGRLVNPDERPRQVTLGGLVEMTRGRPLAGRTLLPDLHRDRRRR